MVQGSADTIDALVILSPKKKVNEFTKKVIELDNTNFKHSSGIYNYKMFQKWKESDIAAPGRGRPLKVQMAEAEKEVSKVLCSRSTDSSAFMLGNMKDIFTDKIKEQVAKDGLGPESVTSGCSDKLAKAMLTAVAMGEETGKLTNQSLLMKTEKRFQAEHSILSA